MAKWEGEWTITSLVRQRWTVTADTREEAIRKAQRYELDGDETAETIDCEDEDDSVVVHEDSVHEADDSEVASSEDAPADDGCKINQKEYLEQDGAACPSCGSGDVESEGIEADGTSGSARVRCWTCGAKWIDIWELQGYEDLQAESESESDETE